MVIYRKYRPNFFSEIINQDHIKKTLENEISQGRIGHAYLFFGSHGIGKTTLARVFAKAVNCEKRKEGEFEPCNTCRTCEEINAGRFLDLIEIDAASHRGINEIRELREKVRFPPIKGKYKVFIIDEFHMLTPEAFNALLKTLEEPPKHIIFILATTEIHKVPETIISRCQRFDFLKVSPKLIIERLKKIAQAEKVKVDDEVLKTIAYRAEGSVRDAESLFSQILALNEKEITKDLAEIILPQTQINLVAEFIEDLFKKDVKSAFDLVNRLVEEGVDPERFTKDLVECLRKILLFKIGAENELLEFDSKNQIKFKEISKDVEIKTIIKLIEEFIKAIDSFRWMEIPQLPLELAIIKVCE